MSDFAMRHPSWAIGRGVSFHADSAALAEGIATLTVRRARNRIPRIERAVRMLHRMEEVMERNLEAQWGVTEPDLGGQPAHIVLLRGPLAPASAIGALDRLLTASLDYERTWRARGFAPEPLCPTAMEISGEDAIRELATVAGLRAFLEEAGTQLRERVGEHEPEDELGARRRARRSSLTSR
jgi:hypothetical protein